MRQTNIRISTGMILLVAMAACDDSDQSADGGTLEPGNLTEVSTAACGEDEPSSPRIEGLNTGWFVQGPDGWRLRLSNRAVDCNEALSTLECSGMGWVLDLDLPQETLQSGTHSLEFDHPGNVGIQTQAVWEDGDGCAGGTVGGDRGEGVVVPGTVVLNTVADGCISGTLEAIGTGFEQPELDIDGSFVALRCDESPSG